LNLPRKDAIEAAIVGESRQKRRISGQSDGWQRGSLEIFAESADKLGCHVLAICRTTTITTDQQLSTGLERLSDYTSNC
jgi:hypothetical protein